jgi:manganese transport protein
VVLASLAAMLLQTVSATVGAATGRDLARLCRERLPSQAIIPMWLASEVAIVACDLAEVVGAAVALRLLFGFPLWVGVLVSAVAMLPFLWLQQRGRGWLIGGVMLLTGLVIIALGMQLIVLKPDPLAMLQGLLPHGREFRHPDMLWLIAGIVGATVMPHNLYLHSSLAAPAASRDSSRLAKNLRSIGWDNALSLSVAMLVNIGLLVLAASAFHAHGKGEVGDLAQASRLLGTILPPPWGSVLFALALLGCALNGMVTATLSGQIVMEGFLDLRISLMRRAVITRGLAIVPALLGVAFFGKDNSSTSLLVGSQVVLSLQLPLAVLPMLWLAGNRALMKKHRLRGVLKSGCWTVGGVLIALNALLLWQWA